MGEIKPPTGIPVQRIDLDWKAYFIEFCHVHGEPVNNNGRLLFRDGWTYSASDYSGPEYPPPLKPDELDELVIAYWTIRKDECSKFLLKLGEKLDSIKRVQQVHSLDLQQIITTEDDKGKKRKGYGVLDLTGLEQRIVWVKLDIEECNVRLREIDEYKKTDREKSK